MRWGKKKTEEPAVKRRRYASDKNTEPETRNRSKSLSSFRSRHTSRGAYDKQRAELENELIELEQRVASGARVNLQEFYAKQLIAYRDAQQYSIFHELNDDLLKIFLKIDLLTGSPAFYNNSDHPAYKLFMKANTSLQNEENIDKFFRLTTFLNTVVKDHRLILFAIANFNKFERLWYGNEPNKNNDLNNRRSQVRGLFRLMTKALNDKSNFESFNVEFSQYIKDNSLAFACLRPIQDFQYTAFAALETKPVNRSKTVRQTVSAWLTNILATSAAVHDEDSPEMNEIKEWVGDAAYHLKDWGVPYEESITDATIVEDRCGLYRFIF